MSELKDLFYKAIQSVTREHIFEAILGDGDGNLYSLNDSKPEYCYARILKPTSTSITSIRFTNITPVYNMPVYVYESPIDGIMEAFSVNYSKSKEFFNGYPQGNVGLHSAQHGYYGSDPVRIEALQYYPLLTYPTEVPSLSVNLAPLVHTVGTSYQGFLGGETSLASFIPTVGSTQTFVVVGIGTGNDIQIKESGRVETYAGLKASPFTLEDLEEVIFDADFVPSSMVRLYEGQSRIDNFDIFGDARLWLSGGGGGSGYEIFNGTASGAYAEIQYTATVAGSPDTVATTFVKVGTSSNVEVAGSTLTFPPGYYLFSFSSSFSWLGADQSDSAFVTVKNGTSDLKSVADQSVFLSSNNVFAGAYSAKDATSFAVLLEEVSDLSVELFSSDVSNTVSTLGTLTITPFGNGTNIISLSPLIRVGSYDAIFTPENEGDTFYSLDSPYLRVYNGTAWITKYNGITTNPPADLSWAWVNQGGATVVSNKGTVVITAPTDGGGGNQRIRERDVPATPYMVDMLFAPLKARLDFHNISLGFRDSASGKLEFVTAQYQSDTIYLYSLQYSDANTFSGSNVAIANQEMPCALRISDDGVDRSFFVSYDGVNFIEIFSHARTTYLTPDKIFFALASGNSTNSIEASILGWYEH